MTDMKTELAALVETSRSNPLEVAVKPLEWTQEAPPGHEFEAFTYWAPGLGGNYRVGQDGLLWMAHDAFVWEQHLNQKAAQAAAQADHEQRIRSALSTHTSPQGVDDEVVARLVVRTGA